jgi:hypothetical protein
MHHEPTKNCVSSLLYVAQQLIWSRVLIIISFLNARSQGHVPFIAMEPPLSSVAEESGLSDEHRLDKQFNDRWRTLLSVDDLVYAVVEALETTGLSSTTYLFYSSE